MELTGAAFDVCGRRKLGAGFAELGLETARAQEAIIESRETQREIFMEIPQAANGKPAGTSAMESVMQVEMSRNAERKKFGRDRICRPRVREMAVLSEVYTRRCGFFSLIPKDAAPRVTLSKQVRDLRQLNFRARDELRAQLE
jgi:hypothetical protein